jgi:23S rRNA pseudouridine2605 synthase
MIQAGRVTVDGEPAHLGQKVDPATARVEVDGVPLPIKPGLVYYLLYKPAGVVSTAADPQGRPTVVDLVPPGARVYPVGRLDADSEGLVILTNDGDLAERVTHPRHGVPKTYLARVAGNPGRAAVRALTTGVELDDGPARALRAQVVGRQAGEALVELVMGEGRKREVRRLLAAVGYPVLALVRTAIGRVVDPGLKPGSWRELTLDEVRSLYMG